MVPGWDGITFAQGSLANRVNAALSVPTAAGPLYDVDTRLRPQGEQGMLDQLRTTLGVTA